MTKLTKRWHSSSNTNNPQHNMNMEPAAATTVQQWQKETFYYYKAPCESDVTVPRSNAGRRRIYEVELDLPPNEHGGLAFVGTPPKVSFFDASVWRSASSPGTMSPTQPFSLIHYYLVSIAVPGSVHISLVRSACRLQQILSELQHLPRKIVLSPTRPRSTRTVNCMYKHQLPATVFQGEGGHSSSLGLEFHQDRKRALPAQLVHVSRDSPLHDSGARSGQYVEALILPQETSLGCLTNATPTASGLDRILRETHDLPGRQLVLVEPSQAGLDNILAAEMRDEKDSLHKNWDKDDEFLEQNQNKEQANNTTAT